MWKCIKEWFMDLVWSARWERDEKWRKATLKRLDEGKKRAEASGKKFVNTALRRFVEKQPKEA